MKKNILQIKNVVKRYKQKDNDVLILDDININIVEGEIVGIIGRSGSGKSTLLRIISDLLEPTEGEVIYNNKPVKESKPKIGMVFQSFGLIPWLNVFDNIALGLEEQKLPKTTIHEKVSKAINLIGLRGYGEAYPKEMSGGMRQRVGFARALVIDPEILLMDEAFSALDYITEDTLKSDLIDLWLERDLSSIKTIILVTHSIEEAVSLCDRVIVLSSNPGKVIADIAINIPHPRDTDSQKFKDTMDSLYLEMTNVNNMVNGESDYNLQRYYPQPISVVDLFHFLEEIKSNANDNNVDIQVLSEELKLKNDQMIVYIETLVLLKFIEHDNNDIRLSPAGHIVLDADEHSKKMIFKEHLTKYVKFINMIYHKLLESPKALLTKKELLRMLERKFSREQANKILSATIGWARYADLFSYDNIKEELRLDPILLGTKEEHKGK